TKTIGNFGHSPYCVKPSSNPIPPVAFHNSLLTYPSPPSGPTPTYPLGFLPQLWVKLNRPSPALTDLLLLQDKLHYYPKLLLPGRSMTPLPVHGIWIQSTYVAPTSWTPRRIKRYIDTKPNHELIHYCLKNPPYEYTWNDKVVSVTEGSSETTTERYIENYKNVSQDIHDQLNAEAEAVQIILTVIDNDIYSTVNACPNACEMWKAIKRLKQGESINVQDLETNLYWEFGKFTSRDGESLESYYSRFYKIINELVRNQYDVTNHQVNV
nr:RNA-directed DNA polymerase, eukaryota [Tanacetum cinerariifolium]